ncbi:MAG: hypothetical protein HC777_01225 [Hyphomonadaceae bacterium]|nr:hypothetical protein [Hyphomonadaceae bacterium]
MLKNRPAGGKAIAHMMQAKPPPDRNLEAWLNWMDTGLKAATYSAGGLPPAPIWRRGIRDVLNETIVQLADLPDTELRSRKGQLANSKYEARIWSQGCKEIDLSTATTFTDTVTILPLAARCYKVKLDAASTRASPQVLELSSSNTTNPAINVDVAPTWLTVTMSAQGDRFACGDLDMGSLGQIIPTSNLWDLSGANDGTCMVQWPIPFLPLNTNDPNGLRGYQNLIFVNANDIAINSQERTFTLHVTRPSSQGQVTGSARPSGGGAPRRNLPSMDGALLAMAWPSLGFRL